MKHNKMTPIALSVGLLFCCAAHAADLPGVLWTPAWALRRFSPLQSVCVAGHEADRRATLRAELDEWLGRSMPAFPASVLGL